MLFSSEINNAMKLGYKFEILWGYTFNSENVFKEYVDTLYKLRLEYPKSDPLNLVAKLLLNSLYGRFGMEDSFAEITIFSNKELYLKFESKHSDDIIDIIELDDKILVKHRSLKSDVNTLLDNASESHNTSIAIASAITAYARIHMSQFKNNLDYNLYYSDTDSIYIDKPLDDSLVNSKVLGLMKLENIIDKAIFLAPKVYCLELENGDIVYKVKGLSHDINLTLDDFTNLLNKDSLLQKYQVKWRKHIEEGNISVIEQLYTLQVTDNKRKLIYQNGILVNTKPFVINKNKDID
jgi:hypothetical protein